MFLATAEARTISAPLESIRAAGVGSRPLPGILPACFWHSPRDSEITEELIPFVIRGLRANGGHRGFKLAGMLQNECLSE